MLTVAITVAVDLQPMIIEVGAEGLGLDKGTGAQVVGIAEEPNRAVAWQSLDVFVDLDLTAPRTWAHRFRETAP